MTVATKPKAGEVEQRSAPETSLTIDGNKLQGLIPYGVESRDLGGWTEIIEPGALDGADMSDLVATLNHAGVPLGRYDSTLTVENRDNGVAWSVELGDGPTASDVRAAVERGDLREGSWRMVVGKDRWTGTTRHITEIPLASRCRRGDDRGLPRRVNPRRASRAPRTTHPQQHRGGSTHETEP